MIPKIIHQFWYGRPMSFEDRTKTVAVQTMNPEWEYRFHDGTDDLQWLNHLFIDAHRYSPRPNVFRSNLVRYEQLYIHGGIVIDVDKVAVRTLDALPDVDVIAATNGTNPDPGVLGASPQHPMIGRLIELASQQAAVPWGGVEGCEHLVVALADYPDVTIQPSNLFYPRHRDDPAAILVDPWYLKGPHDLHPVRIVPEHARRQVR